MKADCLCGPLPGKHCGTRIDDGYLSTNCLRNSTYQCDCTYTPAKLLKECHDCKEDNPGSDICIATCEEKLLRKWLLNKIFNFFLFKLNKTFNQYLLCYKSTEKPLVLQSCYVWQWFLSKLDHWVILYRRVWSELMRSVLLPN
jgi:hypothetical protein